MQINNPERFIRLLEEKYPTEQRKKLTSRLREKYPQLTDKQIFIVYASIWEWVSRAYSRKEKRFPNINIIGFGQFQSQRFRSHWRRLRKQRFKQRKQNEANSTE